MKSLNEIIAATLIASSTLIMGCASTPKQGQFDRKKTVLSPLGGPAHPVIMAIYGKKLVCEEIEEKERIIGVSATSYHWLIGKNGSSKIMLPENAEFSGLSQTRGKIIIIYEQNGRKIREEYGLGLSPSANNIKLGKRHVYNQDRKKWERVK